MPNMCGGEGKGRKKRSVPTPALVRQAVAMVLPAIKYCMDTGLVKRKTLHVTVFSPHEVEDRAQNCLFDETVLEADKEYDYPKFAWRKGRLSVKYGMPSGEIVARYPFLLEGNDPPLAGSDCCHGLVVACSGVEGYFDEMFSSMILAAIIALSKNEMEKVILPSDADSIDEAYAIAEQKR